LLSWFSIVSHITPKS